MRVYTILRGSILASALVLGACVNPYEGVHPGYFVTAGQTLDAAEMNRQDTEDGPRCFAWSESITPSKAKMMAAYGFNNLVAGAAGGGGGNAANAAIQGAAGVGTAGLAGAAYGGITGGLYGAVQGGQTRDVMAFGWNVWCRAASAGGYYAVSHDEAVKRAAEGIPFYVGGNRPQDGQPHGAPPTPYMP